MTAPFTSASARYEVEVGPPADGSTRARVGRLTLGHGVVETPQFMPVGTNATVKALDPDDIREVGPDADAVAPTEPPPPPVASAVTSVSPADAAAPEAAEPIADETEPIPPPGSDPVASGGPSDAVPPREDGVPRDQA